MAKVLKVRARKPVIESGDAVASTMHRDEKESLYRLDVQNNHHPYQVYSIYLKRHEMLKTVESWIAADAEEARRQFEEFSKYSAALKSIFQSYRRTKA